MDIQRKWAMPGRWTFKIQPITKLIQEEWIEGIWIDPFAGEFSPAHIRNDISPDRKAEYHLDALEFLRQQESNSVDGILYDPPYSITQARMYGKKKFSSMKYWGDCKNEMARVLKPGGKIISFGWNSNGIGKGRYFEKTRILLVPHGGSKNDTIVVVEKKLKPLFS